MLLLIMKKLEPFHAIPKKSPNPDKNKETSFLEQ